jgi:hypothetical protein
MATHDSNIAVSLAFGPPPITVAGFNTIALLDSGSDLDTDRIRTYASAAEAAADGDLSAFAIAAATAAFAQSPAPAAFKVIEVDLTAPETYAAAYAAAKLIDPDFYIVCLDTRAPATIAGFIPTIEAEGQRVLWFQDNDSAWLTNTPPASYSALLESERAVLVFHETDADPAAEASAAARYSFDVDQQTQGFEGNIAGAITPNDHLGLTTAEKNFLLDTNNGNILLPFGPRTNYLSPGQNLAGRPISEILAGDWLRARVVEDLTRNKLAYDARGEIIPVSTVGQTIVKGVLKARVDLGVAIGKFKPGQVVIQFPAITQADIDAQRIRATIYITTNTPASKFVISLNLTSADVVATTTV